MIAILTVLVAVPLGYFCINRVVPYLVYVAAFTHVYTLQTANLVMEWVNGSGSAFRQDSSQRLFDATWGYLAFTSLIYLAGFGLIRVGQLLQARRTQRAAGVDLASANQ